MRTSTPRAKPEGLVPRVPGWWTAGAGRGRRRVPSWAVHRQPARRAVEALSPAPRTAHSAAVGVPQLSSGGIGVRIPSSVVVAQWLRDDRTRMNPAMPSDAPPSSPMLPGPRGAARIWGACRIRRRGQSPALEDQRWSERAQGQGRAAREFPSPALWEGPVEAKPKRARHAA